MSTFSVTVSIRHEGRTVPGFPLTRRLESSTQEANLVDQVWPDTDSQEPVGDAAISALWFEKPATVQIGTYTGTLTFAVGADSVVLLMNTAGISFTPLANSRIRGVA